MSIGTPNPNFLREMKYHVACAKVEQRRIKKIKSRIAESELTLCFVATDFLDLRDARYRRKNSMNSARKWKKHAFDFAGKPDYRNAMSAEAEAQNLAEFEANHPNIAAWWNGSKFQFAIDMRQKVMRWGSLTAGQLAASIRCANKFESKVR